MLLERVGPAARGHRRDGTRRGRHRIRAGAFAIFSGERRRRAFRGAPVVDGVIAEAEQQLDTFAELLAARGIIVRRPDPVDQTIAVKTPNWELAHGRASACPRDVLLVIGDEVIEAPMAQRARFFEYRAYRSLMAEYFRRGARWTAVPKPLMSDRLYDERPLGATFDYAEAPLLTEIEPAFDAASFVRFGRDIFWQPRMIELLESLGCEVIPCAFDRVYPFGGGFHCCTTDVRRDGTLQSYFPSLDG